MTPTPTRTSVGVTPPTPPARPAFGRAASRIGAAVRLEFRVQLRYQVITTAAALTAAWTLLLVLLPEPTARLLGPYVLIVDTATFGAFFVAALFLLERGEGALAALAASPLRLGEYVGAKLGTLTGVSVAAAVPVTLAAGRGRLHDLTDLPGLLGPVLLGVGLAALLILALSLLLVVPYRSLTGYVTTTPLLLVPLLATPLAHLAGVLDHPLASLVPTTGAADLFRAGITPQHAPSWPLLATTAVYLLVWVGVTVRLARARLERALTQPRQPRTRPAPARPAPGVQDSHRRRHTGWAWGWVGAFSRADLHNLRTDLLLGLLLVAPVLLAITLRLGYPPAAAYAGDRFGADLAPYTPLLLVLLVVIHVPMITGMAGALLILDDLDERRLLLLQVTPVTLERYLGYRVASTGAVALLGLTLAVPLAGLGTTPPPAVVLAAAQAPLLLLAVVALARNKVQGLAAIKLLSGLLMAAASSPWWLPAAVHRPLLLLPPAAPGLVQYAAEAGDTTGLVVAFGMGTAATLVTGAALTRLVVRRLTT